MPLASGTRVGPYEIVAPLGAGGMGEVYRAHDSRLGRDVALKILPAEVAGDPSRRQRFETEARAVAALNHPNIVAVYDVGDNYIISELIEGEPIGGVKFGLRKTVDIATQIASGLAVAHAAGITHRDLKPDNILLTRDGRVKILDFGLAKVAATRPAADTETQTVQTEPGMVMGTAGYMSPEQVRGLAADHRSDIFSFGVILYELLTGERAFHGETSVDTMRAILRQDPPDLPETVPSGMRQIVAHCLEKDPINRFQSARDLGFALSAVAQSGSQSSAARIALPRPAWRRRSLALLAGLALVALGAGIGSLWLRQPQMPQWKGVLLGGSQLSLFPRLSPDGHWLASIESVGGSLQVGVMKPESATHVILTHSTDKGFTVSLSWSPDGAKIYYDRWTDVPRGVFSVPFPSGEEQLVLEDATGPEALPDSSLLVARYNAERQLQLFRFWPETGRLQGFPLELTAAEGNVPAVRAFSDGKEAVAIGARIGEGREPGRHAYVVDLTSGKVRKISSPLLDDAGLEAAGVTRDGKSILLSGNAGTSTRVIAVPRRGSSAGRPLLALTSFVTGVDTGSDGSIYLDQMSRPMELLRFAPEGGHAEQIAAFPMSTSLGGFAEPDETIAVLSDGRVVVPQLVAGRQRLMLIETGKDPVPLINTSEENAAPAAAVGSREVAFLIGAEPKRTIAVATVSNGRIVRKIPFDHGYIRSLAATPDGATIFCAAGGSVWSMPASGGEAKKIRAGDQIAIDPTGQSLLVEVIETPVIRLFRVPLHGGAEQEIRLSGGLRPANIIGPNAIDKTGRILTPLGSSTWYWPPGLIDASGHITAIPIENPIDYHVLAWAPDGKVIAEALGMRSTIWKFEPENR